MAKLTKKQQEVLDYITATCHPPKTYNYLCEKFSKRTINSLLEKKAIKFSKIDGIRILPFGTPETVIGQKIRATRGEFEIKFNSLEDAKNDGWTVWYQEIDQEWTNGFYVVTKAADDPNFAYVAIALKKPGSIPLRIA